MALGNSNQKKYTNSYVKWLSSSSFGVFEIPNIQCTHTGTHPEIKNMSQSKRPFQKKRIVFQSYFSGEVSFRGCNHLIIGFQEDIFLGGFFVDELFGDEGPLEGISWRKEISWMICLWMPIFFNLGKFLLVTLGLGICSKLAQKLIHIPFDVICISICLHGPYFDTFPW